MKLPITIEYNSGDEVTYVTSPSDIAKWEVKSNKTMTTAQQNPLGYNDWLIIAYNCMKRESGAKPVKSYEVWIDTVANMTIGDADPKATQSDQ